MQGFIQNLNGSPYIFIFSFFLYAPACSLEWAGAAFNKIESEAYYDGTGYLDAIEPGEIILRVSGDFAGNTLKMSSITNTVF